MSNRHLTSRPFYVLLAYCLFQVGLAEGASPGGDPQPRLLTNFVQVLKLPRNEAQGGLPVSLTAWVVGVQADKDTIFLRDATGAWELKLPGCTANYEAGQKIGLLAKTCWSGTGPDLETCAITLQEPRPEPVQISPGQRVPSPHLMRWVELAGTVSFAGASGQEARLEVSDRDHQVAAHILNAGRQDFSGLLSRRIRLRGVAQACFNAAGDLTFGSLWVAGMEAIHLTNPDVQDWNSSPLESAARLRQIVSGMQERPTLEPSAAAPQAASLGSLVRLCGTLAESNEGGWGVIDDGTGKVAVSLLEREAARQGDALEVMGVLARRDNLPVLYCACLRPAGTAVKLPLLTSIEQILRLNAEEAGRGYPVRVRGVATGGNAYIQDGSRSISVWHRQGKLVFGGYYEIKGKTRSGDYAPLLKPTATTYLGPGQLPEPIHPTWSQLASGAPIGQWLEVRGMVLSVATNTMTVAIPGGRVRVKIRDAATNSLAEFNGGVVRLRGTYRCAYNEQRQLTGFWIEVPSPAFISLEEPPPSEPFSVQSHSVAETMQFDPEGYHIRAIKLMGQIIFHAGQSGFLSDGTNGIRYALRTEAALRPGDVVEMVGIPQRSGFASVLREAMWRRVGHELLPPAPACALVELQRGNRDAMRVRVKGQVLAVSTGLTERVLALLVESEVIPVRVQSSAGSSGPAIEPGCTVELTGVCARQPSEDASAFQTSSFDLVVASPGDVRILKRPSWWTFQHSLEVTTLAGAGLVLALGWIWLLRIQVAERTRQVQAQVLETERTARQRYLEQERARIARDLHDNLGSSLTEISMLAETGHHVVPGAEDSRNRFGQILDRAHGLVRTLDETVWAVDPAKDTLRSLVRYLASFAEEFVSAAGMHCRIEVPPGVPDTPLMADLRHDLFLATKEALNNAVCHSKATEIRFSFRLVPDGLEIRVADNGRGFDPGAAVQGNGLRNLRERMRAANRRCEIDSRPGTGTTILLAVNLSVGEAAPPA